MKSRTRAAVGILMVVGLIAAGCSSDDAGDSTTTTAAQETTTTVQEATTTTTTVVEDTTTVPEELATVKVVTLPFITFAPFYIGIEEGYFAEQGIEVELVNMTVQEEILPALSSGQVDVSSGLVSAGMFNAIARGSDIKLTADKGFIDPDSCVNYTVIGRSDLVEAGELETADQLAGTTINVVPATWLEYYLGEILATGGLTLDDIEKTNISAPAVPDGLNSGSLDAAVNSEPWVTIMANSGHVPVLQLPQEILPGESAAVIVFGPTLLNDDSDRAARFMAGYLKSAAQYAEGKTEQNLDIIEEFTGLDRGLLEAMCWSAINPEGDIATDGIVAFQEFAVDRGYMDETVPVEQFYDESFLTEAKERLEAAG